jgi:c-di-GMP-binding flagellar brake protein YcgR
MRPRRLVSPRDAAAIFDRAVHDRSLAVLTLQDGSDWRSFKSRFLERDAKNRFFVLDYQAFDNEPLPTLTPGQYLGVSFRQKNRKLLFATVVEAKGHFILDEKTSLPAVRYRWPDSITELQRRAYYRTPVRDDMTLLVSLWPGGLRARGDAQTAALRVATGELADLSCGGALVRLHQQAPPDFAPNQTLGVELQLPDGRAPLVVDALFRGARSDEAGTLSAAIQFIGLELSVDGRRVLQRLANSVQRLHRLTLAAGRGV